MPAEQRKTNEKRIKTEFWRTGLVEKRVTEFQDALADIDDAAAYFDEVLGEQEGEAVEALVGRHREMEEEIRYFQDILSQLETLLGNYISDMEGYIMPKDENRMMLVDRNDIWWNMKQIEANLSYAKIIASGAQLDYYSDIDSTPPEPHIYEGMSPEDESAARDRYRQQLQESQNRKANYNKLRGFCGGTAGRAKTSLEESYGSLEELYKKHVVEFENTDDDYRKKAAQVYDACTSAAERRWDAVVKTAKFFNDINEGANAAVYDFVSGILGLAVMLAKIDLALRVAVVTVPFGTTPQWVKDTGKEAIEGVLGIAQILKNPGRTLAALGQKATDAVEEKGIPYVVSYTVTDIAVGRLVDWGVGKLRGLDKADDLSKISTKIDDMVDAADDVADVTKAVDKLDDVVDAVDDVADVTKAVEKASDVAGVGGLEGGTKTIHNIRELSNEQIEALIKYTGDDYANINNSLRGIETLTPENQVTVEAMKSALNNSALSDDMILYRGTSTEALGSLQSLSVDELVGKTFTEQGFMSTSSNNIVAESFSGNMQMTIEASKGAQALDISSISLYTTEAEVLFNTGQEMLITSAEIKNGILHITAIIE